MLLRRRGIAVLLMGGALIFGACTAETPIPSPASSTPTAGHLPTHAGTLVRATLPPTWTLTPTPPPSPTLTPTPVTPTATPTPLPNLDQVCASLTVSRDFADGHTFGWNDTITLIFGTPLTTAADPQTGEPVALQVRFLATHALSGENLGAQLDGGQIFGMELPVDQLPRPGYYDWKVAVYGAGIGEQCAQTGSFFVYRAATPEVTPEAAQGYRIKPDFHAQIGYHDQKARVLLDRQRLKASG